MRCLVLRGKKDSGGILVVAWYLLTALSNAATILGGKLIVHV